ncbi:MAG: RNA polymerase sigma factor [Minisyncoccia bacterium]
MNLDKYKKRFETVYFNESDAIFRYCFFRVSNREVCTDLVQEIFMRYWDTLVSDKEVNNDRAFLFTISRNLIIDYYRKKKSVSLDSILEETGDASIVIMDDKNDPKISAEGRFVLEKIDELASQDRQVVYLRFVEGMRPIEIAEVLQVSANVVSVRLNRALDKLREITGIDIDKDE